MTKPLRQTMPTVATFIDQMRAAFGPDDINAAIRAGIAGQPTFHASENGMQVGTRAAGSDLVGIPLSECQIGPFNATAAQRDSRRGK